MADTNQENFIELKEFKANDLELDDNEIEHLKTHHNNHIELETLPGKKTRLKTTEHVGQIVLPTNRIIKIIPKIGDVGFFDLLFYTEGIPKSIRDEISTAKGGKTLVEVLAKYFVKSIKEIIDIGLYRKYYRITEQTYTIRGRLLLAQTIRTPYNLDGKVWCEYNKIGYNVLENQAILYCTILLLNSVKDNDIRNELLDIRKTLLSQEISQKIIHSYELETYNIHRLNEHYEIGLKLCKYILDDMWYQEFSIHHDMPTLTWLHDMNDLFEKFVTKILRETYEPEFKIRSQKHFKNILDDSEVKKAPKMKPDNVITRDDDNKLILDTKYKKAGKANSSDFYQATSYSLKLNCDCILLVPETSKKIENRYKISGTDFYVYENSIKFPDEKDDVVEILKEQILDIIEPILKIK